jgi:hypothetical protein
MTQRQTDDGCQGRPFEDDRTRLAEFDAKDMQPMPPTTEPLSHNFLGETFVSIFAAEKERQPLRTHTRPTDLPSTELEHSASRSGDSPSARIAR